MKKVSCSLYFACFVNDHVKLDTSRKLVCVKLCEDLSIPQNQQRYSLLAPVNMTTFAETLEVINSTLKVHITTVCTFQDFDTKSIENDIHSFFSAIDKELSRRSNDLRDCEKTLLAKINHSTSVLKDLLIERGAISQKMHELAEDGAPGVITFAHSPPHTLPDKTLR